MIKNSNLVIDMEMAVKRWSPIVESLGKVSSDKLQSLCEYAEMHSKSLQSGMVNENAMYANGVNTAGMGNVIMPGVNSNPGMLGAGGSGDLAQTLLPASVKIAAQTPGLDLVPMINVNSNRVDLLFFDYKYDDTTDLDNSAERASTFKFLSSTDTALKAWLRAEMLANGVQELRGRISKSLWFHLSGTFGSTTVAPVAAYNPTVAPTGSKQGWVQFKGFSRITEMPMFRIYTQDNSASTGGYGFDVTLNTFPMTGSLVAFLSAATLDDTITSTASQTIGTVAPLNISMVSLNEDLIDDFTTARKSSTMTRGEWDTNTAGKIGPSSEVKTVQIGVSHVSAALRLSEINDYKRMYNVDIVERTKAQLVNLIQQKISIEIVEKIKELGLRNRATLPSAPAAMAAALLAGGISDGKIFDMSVTQVASLGGEHSASIARKLWSKVSQGSQYIFTDGRIGGADFIICSGAVVSIFESISGYIINPFDSKVTATKQLTPQGTINGLKVYVDPYMNQSDLTIYLGCKGTADSPGIKFLAYMLAENVEVVSENTMAPHLYMYSRYAVAELGYFPEKQYMAIKVEDVDGLLY